MTVEPIERIRAEAIRSWPQLHLHRQEFREHLEDLAARGELHDVDPAGLGLAWACAHQEPAALEAFEWTLIPTASRALRRLGVAEAQVDDLLQRIRVRLLVGAEGRPAQIAGFNGRGTLQGWLRVVAVREGLGVLRRGPPAEEPLDARLVGQLGDPGDLELALMKDHFLAEFRAATREAVAALAVRERLLLRMQVVDRMSVDEIASVYRVHRVTASRWFTRIRAELRAAIESRLSGRLSLAADELRSLVGMIRSQLHVSLAGELVASVADSGARRAG